MAERVCPVWIGYLLASPLRRFLQSPEKIIGPYIEPGMTVLDAGCAMGFFSIPAARMVGSEGRVICVDLQPKMIKSLEKRAAKAKVSERIDARVCSSTSLEVADLAGQVNFALAFAVVHEVPDPAKLIEELSGVLAPGGRLLVSEPKGHITDKDLKKTSSDAAACGLELADRPSIPRSISALFVKKS